MKFKLERIEVAINQYTGKVEFCFWFWRDKKERFNCSSLYVDVADYSRFIRSQRPKIIKRECKFAGPFKKPNRIILHIK